MLVNNIINIFQKSIGYVMPGDRLEWREFNYMKKPFKKLKINSEEVVGRTFDEIISILKSRDNKFEEISCKCRRLEEAIKQATTSVSNISVSDIMNGSCSNTMNVIESKQELNKYLAEPSMQLFYYIQPLYRGLPMLPKKDLIVEDKKALALKFKSRKEALQYETFLSMCPSSRPLLIWFLLLAPLDLCNVIMYCLWWRMTFYLINACIFTLAFNCYYEKYKSGRISADKFASEANDMRISNKFFKIIIVVSSWWKRVFYLINVLCDTLVNEYNEKYENRKISATEHMNTVHYIQLCNKLLCVYPLIALSFYSLAINFVSNELIIRKVIPEVLFILIEVILPIFSKSGELCIEKHIRDLEDSKYRVQKVTDLLEWYDPHRLLMPIVIPVVKKKIADLENELAERDFDELICTNVEPILNDRGIV